jgi:hypothetical protein
MADRYWVGGTDSWNSVAGTKWATTSGGAGGASVPINADDVFFDAASGAVTATVVGAATCRNLDCTGYTGSISAQNGTVPILTIVGNLTLSATMGSFGNFFGACRIVPPNVAVTITTNGKQVSWGGFITANARGLTFDNSGGGSSASITLLDTLQVQHRAFLTGTVSLNLNNFSLDLLSGSIEFIINCGVVGPTLNFGTTGKIIVRTGGNQIPFFTSAGSNVTFTGSKLVSVDIPSSAAVLTQSSGGVYGTAAQALNYVSTATNQGQFRVFTAENVDWSLGTGIIRIDRASNTIYGNWNSGTKNISKTPTGACTLSFQASSGTKTISGTGFWSNITLVVQPQAAGVTYNLGTSLSQAQSQYSTFTWTTAGLAATFNTNNYPILTGGLEASGGTCNLGTSQISSYGTNFASPTPFLVSFGAGVDASAATIIATFGNSRLLASNMTIGTLNISVSLTVTIPPTSSNLTFNTITNNTAAANAQIDFPSGVTTTVNNFNYSGQATPSLSVVRIRSTTPGTRAILSKASGAVNVSYVDIQDSEATGGATWTALLTNGNIDSGNNIGWYFGLTIVNVTGVAATGEVGVATVVTLQNETVNVTGVSATGDVGTVVFPIDVDAVGVQATGEVGNVTVVATTNANVNLIGVQATGEVGILFFYQWSTIIDTQDPNWVPVNDLQTPIWATINPNSSPVWTDVVI